MTWQKVVSNLEENTSTQNKINPMLIVGVVIAVLVIGAVVVLGMGTRNTSDLIIPKDVVEGETMEVDETTTAENIIEVEGGAFYYKPNVIRVVAGEPVTIKLNSVDMMHDFVIDELNVRTEIIQDGNSTTVTFIPTEPGEYEFYCSVGNHRAQGMVGTLIVE